MGRKKRWGEDLRLTLSTGSKALMDSALRDGEDRLDLIREAISRELTRRGRTPLPGPVVPETKDPEA